MQMAMIIFRNIFLLWFLISVEVFAVSSICSDVFSGKVEDLNLTPRISTALKSNNIESIAELIRKTPKEILSIPTLGPKSLSTINEKLAERGLSLNMNRQKIKQAEVLEIINQTMKEITRQSKGKQQASTITREEIRSLIFKIAQPVNTLISSSYVLRTLKAHNIYMIKDLIQFTPQELSTATYLRDKPIKKIRKALQKKGLDLGGKAHTKFGQILKAINAVLNRYPKSEEIFNSIHTL